MSIDKISSLVKKERENKMAEEIEMRDRSRVEKMYKNDYEEGESSFGEWDSYSENIFLSKIEDPVMRERVRSVFTELDKGEDFKERYKKSINQALWEDQLDLDYWDGVLIPEEKEKFAHEQKINNLNQALAEYDIFLDPKDPKIKYFLDSEVQNTFSDKKQEINGYRYKGTQIIGRTIARVFYVKWGSAAQDFIADLKEEIGKTARSQIAAESNIGDDSVKSVAMEYIGLLREEQHDLIDNVKTPQDMRNAQDDVNEMEKEIKLIKKNSSFKMRIKIFRKSLSYKFTKLLRFLWKHKGKTLMGTASFLIALTGILLSQFGVIQVVHNLKKGMAAVKEYSDHVQKMGRDIIKNIQSIYRVPGTLVGYIFIGLGIFLRILYFVTRISGSYSGYALFGALGVTVEALIAFDQQAKQINEKAADIVEGGGNAIEEFGKRAEKRVLSQMKDWYNKPTNEKPILEVVESSTAKMAYFATKGIQKTGKTVESAGEIMRTSLWYLRLFVIGVILILTIKFLNA